ncbi:DUF1178 family protein [Tropicimonas sp. S265A]|uniref:DUF1178 family protein n=1 Tax=Tropicimonas sp. S265A TaxID=3415134 RepID=UPI003C7E2DC0
MIRYSLKCEHGHQFDSWFQSAEAFDTLVAGGLTSCAICGSTSVSKALMTPGVATGDTLPPPRTQAPGPDAPALDDQTVSLTTPSTPLEKAIAQLRADVEANSEYVGKSFAREARRMHDGDAPARAIYGEAKIEEARALAEDGVPVVPLPFGPQRKIN